MYRRSRCIDNVRSDKALAAEDHQSWGYPRECYELYTSAEVHTVKRTLSSKAKRGFVLAGIAAAFGKPAEEGRRVVYANATDYARKHLPRFPTMPWTAEIYDQRPITTDPQLYCLATGDGLDAQGNLARATAAA